MEEKYRNKYRTSSARLTGWDYGSHGLYFVTICTKDRVHYFGEIEDITNETGETQGIETQSIENQIIETQSIVSLREIGKVAHDNWLSIPHFHPYVELDDFVIMPDHMHGILFINKPDKLTWEANKFGTQSQNLASIIRGYKSSVKQYAVVNGIGFAWQAKFYDRVIRNEQEYIKIRNYIYNNPEQWMLNNDDFENLFDL